MEPPECPVCLDPYSATTTVPLVLPCGHSICSLCIPSLPALPSHPSLVRCPSCTLPLRLPPNPSSLPRNFDLLRLLPHSPPRNTPVSHPPPPPPPFIPSPFDSSLYPSWRHRIHNSRPNLSAMYPVSVSADDTVYKLAHEARIMRAVIQLPETVRTELSSLFQLASRHVGKVHGLWMEGDELLLACEELRRVEVREGLFEVGMMGMEMCEAVMEVHGRGVVCGCLSLLCFGVDEFGHCLLDLNGVLGTGRTVRERNGGEEETQAFVSPEVFASLVDNAGTVSKCGYSSDVWSLACILSMILLGDESLAEGLGRLMSKGTDEYEVWRETLVSKLEAHLLGSELHALLPVLSLCLNYEMGSRPSVRELWYCIRSLFVKKQAEDSVVPAILPAEEDSLCCLILGDLCSPRKRVGNVSATQENGDSLDNPSDVSLVGRRGDDVDGCVIDNLQGVGFKSITLHGHQDCVTGLAVGGGFLFSSSYDKTVHVWSLQEFSLVQSLRGHEHKVTAMVVLDENQPLCISGDSGRDIFVWRVDTSLGSEPLKKWSEHNDWRYGGVYSLAVSGTEYLYSGSGDKTIKAWSLKDYSLLSTMVGHRSTVSSLAVADGILYSGSWDGTIRMWLLSDLSPLSVLGDYTPGSSPPVLALSVDHHLLASYYEDRCLKIWSSDVLVRTMKIQNGTIFALHVDKKWLFTGGSDKIVSIQELLENELQLDIRPVGSVTCDSPVTSLLYHNGKLFVGFYNKEIKVYKYEY